MGGPSCKGRVRGAPKLSRGIGRSAKFEAWPKLASALWFPLAQARPDRLHDYLYTPLVTDTQTNVHKGGWIWVLLRALSPGYEVLPGQCVKYNFYKSSKFHLLTSIQMIFFQGLGNFPLAWARTGLVPMADQARHQPGGSALTRRSHRSGAVAGQAHHGPVQQPSTATSAVSSTTFNNTQHRFVIFVFSLVTYVCILRDFKMRASRKTPLPIY